MNSDPETTKLTRPARFTQAEMKKVGVTILNIGPDLWLQCDNCQLDWHPRIRFRGNFPRGYWKCPKGCNNPDQIS